MYKKILTISMLIPSIMLAHNVPEEKLKELKTAQEKHYKELEKAKSDLKVAGIATVATPLVFKVIDYIMVDLNLEEKLYKRYWSDAEYITAALVLANASILLYAIYKGFVGAKHYFWPDYPKPEDESL